MLCKWFAQHHLDDLMKMVVPRGRCGIFLPLDFLLVLLVFAVSGESTLSGCHALAAPWAAAIAGLWNRAKWPSRSAFSRFMGVFPAQAVVFLGWLFFKDLLDFGVRGPMLGGCLDRRGTRHVVFDVDGTRQAARQRSLARSPEYPAARRRFDDVCEPGHRGRKRGQVVRTRTVVQQAHSREWLGTWGAPGNGDGYGDLVHGCERIGHYMDHHGLPRSQAIIRLDGLYGHIPPIATVRKAGLGYVTRCCDYAMLDDPAVRAVLMSEPTSTMDQTDTGTHRELFDLPSVQWMAGAHEPMPTRMIVARTRSTPGKKKPVGKIVDGWRYELFVTHLDPSGFTAADVLDLYFCRGAFEQTLSEDDQEQTADRWCSHQPQGQEAWQIVHQWIWNLRIWLGQPSEAVVRQTEMAPAIPDQPGVTQDTAPPHPEPAVPPPPSPAAPSTPEPESVEPAGANSQPPGRVADSWGRGKGRFGGTDFHWKGTDLICPSGKVLRQAGHRSIRKGDRMLYRAQPEDCATCPLRDACLGRGSRLSHAREVTAWKLADVQAPPPTPRLVPDAASNEPSPIPAPGHHPILWEDVPAKAWRRSLVSDIRMQRVDVAETATEPAAPPRLSRAVRAHRRLTIAQRVARNEFRGPQGWTIRLHGLPPHILRGLGIHADLQAA